MLKLLAIILLIPTITMSQIIPSSSRSIKAIEKVKPALINELKQSGLIFGRPVYIRIFKQEGQLEIWIKNNNVYQLFKTYKICSFGFGGLGPKLSEGDGM